MLLCVVSVHACSGPCVLIVTERYCLTYFRYFIYLMRNDIDFYADKVGFKGKVRNSDEIPLLDSLPK